MSSSKSAIAPDLLLKPSASLSVYYVVIGGLSLTSLFIVDVIPLALKMFASFGLMIFICRAWRMQNRLKKIKHKSPHEWQIYFADGTNNKFVLLNDYYVSTWMVVMNFRSASKQKYSVVIPFDRVDASSHRGLRVYLRQNSVAESR